MMLLSNEVNLSSINAAGIPSPDCISQIASSNEVNHNAKQSQMSQSQMSQPRNQQPNYNTDCSVKQKQSNQRSQTVFHLQINAHPINLEYPKQSKNQGNQQRHYNLVSPVKQSNFHQHSQAVLRLQSNVSGAKPKPRNEHSVQHISNL
jgi:hypothetical protein